MPRWALIIVAIAGLMGAAGVMEAAIAAHGAISSAVSQAAQGGPRLLFNSAHFLILDAAAIIAIAAFARTLTTGVCGFLIAASILSAGSLLFCGDLTVHALAGQRLFPFAAPIGGTLMIIGWLMAAASAVWCSVRR